MSSIALSQHCLHQHTAENVDELADDWGMLRECVLSRSPVRLAASHNLLEVHNVGVAALLQHPDLPHRCDWDACENIFQDCSFFSSSYNS